MKTTFDRYHKDVERSLLWPVLEIRKPFSSPTHDDLLIQFPYPAEQRATEVGGEKRTDFLVVETQKAKIDGESRHWSMAARSGRADYRRNNGGT
ncbi:hypothetical protein [Paraburkholderia sp. D1E]|uniref:hypothetical protein n=1 Tax=Paraburkholderia sp. D1E TaxID=3461398 RepID=UPI00404646C2